MFEMLSPTQRAKMAHRTSRPALSKVPAATSAPIPWRPRDSAKATGTTGVFFLSKQQHVDETMALWLNFQRISSEEAMKYLIGLCFLCFLCFFFCVFCFCFVFPKVSLLNHPFQAASLEAAVEEARSKRAPWPSAECVLYSGGLENKPF